MFSTPLPFSIFLLLSNDFLVRSYVILHPFITSNLMYLNSQIKLRIFFLHEAAYFVCKSSFKIIFIASLIKHKCIVMQFFVKYYRYVLY